MQAVRYDRFGGVDQLYLADVPEPAPGAGEVVVRVLAACLNPGSLHALTSDAFTPIRDLAGQVVAVGDDAEFAIGDEVLGWLQDWDAHAQLVLVPAEQLVPKPAGLSWDVAGSLYVTPMAGLAGVRAVRPAKGETVVVSGASGGVGFTSAQLAAHTSAFVIGLTSLSRADLLRQHGVAPVQYGDGEESRVRAAAGERQIKAFIDTVGAGYLDLALALGVLPERINTVVDYRGAHVKGASALGTKEAGGTTALSELAALATSGDLQIPVAAAFPLSAVHDAYRALADRPAPGRIVLHPNAD